MALPVWQKERRPEAGFGSSYISGRPRCVTWYVMVAHVLLQIKAGTTGQNC